MQTRSFTRFARPAAVALGLGLTAGFAAAPASAEVILFEEDFEGFDLGAGTGDIPGLSATGLIGGGAVQNGFLNNTSQVFLADQNGGSTAVITIDTLDITGLTDVVIAFDAASLAGIDQPAEGITVDIVLGGGSPIRVFEDLSGDGLGSFAGTFSGTTLIEPPAGSDNAGGPSPFQSYSLGLAPSVTSGFSTLAVVITEANNAGLEDIAYDNFLVTAVPEPASLALFAAGLGLIGLRRRG